jgi:tetratricopeptide (TPR) repeat protein
MKIPTEKLSIASTLLLLYVATASIYGCGKTSAESAVVAAEARYEQLSNPQGNEQKASREEITNAMERLAEAYIAFADQNPDAPESPERLYKAAELYQVNLLDVNKAIEVYDRIITNYPEHRRAANALFTKGYVYHNTMHDLERAKAAYLQFIGRYPDHELVSHAQFELDNLGLSAKEALERIQSKKDTIDDDIKTNDPG